MLKILRQALFLVLFSLVAGFTAGCAGAAESDDHTYPMAPLADMPAEVRSAPRTVQESYRFAAANPEVLKHIPCNCGCGAMGHTSNYDCYVSSVDASGALTFDPHALGCSICVDITQDTMRLLDEGQSVDQIRAYVDSTYSRYGPSNMP